MTKAMRIPMTYRPDNTVSFWTVRRERFLNSPDAWTFTDDTGYTRFGGRTWAELRDRFCLCAENHNMAHTLS